MLVVDPIKLIPDADALHRAMNGDLKPFGQTHANVDHVTPFSGQGLRMETLHARNITEQGPAFDAYFAVMEHLVHSQSILARILSRSRNDHWSSCLPHKPFVTVGVEGVGHNTFRYLRKSWCSTKKGSSKKPAAGFGSCGTQRSFPSGFRWRWTRNEELAREMLFSDMGNFGGQPNSSASKSIGNGRNATGHATCPKLVFMLRDPVASSISSMRRFWLPCSHFPQDTLLRELYAKEASLREVDNFVRQLDLSACTCTLVLNYEAMTAQPGAFMAPFAAFLGRPNETELLKTDMAKVLTLNRTATASDIPSVNELGAVMRSVLREPIRCTTAATLEDLGEQMLACEANGSAAQLSDELYPRALRQHVMQTRQGCLSAQASRNLTSAGTCALKWGAAFADYMRNRHLDFPNSMPRVPRAWGMPTSCAMIQTKGKSTKPLTPAQQVASFSQRKIKHLADIG